MLHGHLDVVPGRPEQFEPRVDGDRLYGRGAYDMKGGLAAMICAFRDVAAQERVRVHFACVSDEESEELDDRGSDYLVEKRLPRRLRHHRRAHRPPHRHPGEGRARHARRGDAARPRTARLPGSATTPC